MSIPEEFRNLPTVGVYLDVGGRSDDHLLFEIKIDLEPVSDAVLMEILNENLFAHDGPFCQCCFRGTKIAGLRRSIAGNSILVWPVCEHGMDIELFVEK